MKDPYRTLGISREATKADIKRAYHKLALEFHPDRNPENSDAEEKFKEISQAYDLLCDAEKRKTYDTYGDVNPRNIDPFEHMRSHMGFDFGDIFSGMGRESTRHSGDIRKHIVISFMDAAKGCTKKISIDYEHKCSKCNGNGSENGTNLEECSVCNGRGKIGIQRGFLQILQICNGCAGKGSTISKKCNGCSGTGKTKETKKLKISIPPGINTGNFIRVAGKGVPNPYSGKRGDLYLEVKVSGHSKFSMSGNNIVSTEIINYIDAILGSTMSVQTIHGAVGLEIPPGTQYGNVLKIRGKGIRTANNTGDHLISIKIGIPSKISKEERKILETLRAENGKSI